ncbi:MAG: PH domain-containing protein [Candidatus Bathyarchaeota archaeon]|nr:PH domain-containing protein [Candidatus Termiticorpusculum sp.]
MRNNNNSSTHIYEAHYSSATKYYNLLLGLLIITPLAIGCFISLKGPLVFTAIMFLTCIPITIGLVYLTIISIKLRYELSPKELKVKFGVFNKKIPYTQITNIENVQLSLMLKLFGAGMPGLYWGLFGTSIGKVQAYCTKLKGDYIALTLTDGQIIVISPKDPQQFLNALNQQKPHLNTTTLKTNKIQTQISKKLIYTQILIVTATYGIFLSYFYLTYITLPQIVPMHFDFNGNITRWADKTELLWIAILPIMFPIINAAMAIKMGKYTTRNILIMLSIIFIATIAIFVPIIHAIATTA